MTTEELEIILTGSTETQTLDFKESCPWNKVSFAKDILAMANVQEGGTIIIGVKEVNGTYQRQGISKPHKATYNTDIIMDNMSAFADPFVTVNSSIVKDRNKLEYCVLTVEPFKEIPVICKKDSAETHAGDVYYRNRDGRVKSAKISNAHDMRDLIDRASIKSIERARKIGYILPSSKESTIQKAFSERLKKELGEL